MGFFLEEEKCQINEILAPYTQTVTTEWAYSEASSTLFLSRGQCQRAKLNYSLSEKKMAKEQKTFDLANAHSGEFFLQF